MQRKPLIWSLFPSILVVSLVSLFAVTFYSTISIREFYIQDLHRTLLAEGELIQENLRPYLEGRSQQDPDSSCKALAKDSRARVTIIRADGVVLGDSHKQIQKLDNHRDRPEIQEAFQGMVGKSIRVSNTLKGEFMYIALPPLVEGVNSSIVRVSLPLQYINSILREIIFRVIKGGLIVALLAVIVSFWLAHRITRPIESLRKGAENFAKGEFGSKIYVTASMEISSLADALNDMAAQMRDRISKLSRINTEQEAILTGMSEGVIAVDSEERIIILNSAAIELFQIRHEICKGRLLGEVVRKKAVLDFVHRLMHSQEPMHQEISQESPNGVTQHLQLNGSPLRDGKGRQSGLVLVCNDITKVKNLENMRKEFVANVSHELRTPLTSIKGFVETLRDGAYKNSEDCLHFLHIIAKHSERLNSIIEDLLALSKIEKEMEDGQMPVERVRIAFLLERAVDLCRTKAEVKEISLQVQVEPELMGMVSSSLMEQALINLIDNAIKYSENGDNVMISAVNKDGWLKFTVRDQGVGIPVEYLPRIFERFYRVDKARSRDVGGTGLGLAIVKHIARAHNGSVGVVSEHGQGSTFSITVPA